VACDPCARKVRPFLLILAWAAGILLASSTRAEDWPTYQHDNARSGITSERLRLPLGEEWTFRARHKPQPAWEEPTPKPTGGFYGQIELRRIHYDDAYHAVVGGDSVYFGSSADNQVRALDAATGQVRWSVSTGGPVRLAPTVWRDRVLLGSDDGCVYCLQAADGSAIWKLRAAPEDRKVLGNGKMISLWPVRTGVLVDDGIAYFAAGIFPIEGVAVYAVRADNGQLVWKNDAATEDPRNYLSPQGYLLASATRLFAPMGRTSPAAFDRKDGKLLYTANLGHMIGGVQALLADDLLFTGTEEILAFKQDSATQRVAWFQGRHIVVSRSIAYLVTDREILAIDRKAYTPASLARQGLATRRLERAQFLHRSRSARQKTETALKETRAAIESCDREFALRLLVATLTKAGLKGLTAEREDLAKRLAADTKALAAAEQAVTNMEKELAKLAEDTKKAEAAFEATILWRSPCEASEAMILARDVLFVGGKDRVLAFDASDGRPLWTEQVSGRARGLAASGGRLFVSTDQGTIHCFGRAAGRAPQAVAEPAHPTPYPRDELTATYEAAAERILEKTGVRRGYCLVFGAERGRLAFELAKRSDLMIYAVEPDPQKAAEARKALDAAGLLGARVCVDECPLSRVPYSDYFANLVVSDAAMVAGQLPSEAAEMLRMLKPAGGVACLPPLAKPLSSEDIGAWLRGLGADAQEVETAGGWTYIRRSALKGAGSWTHEYGEPGNSACGDDQLVKCPLGVLWFGGPGPGKMLERHVRAAAPLALGGRLFVQGENVVMAYDAYNGLKLWERDIPGALRSALSDECSNFAAGKDSLFVAVNDKCLRLDQATGETTATYELPPAPAKPTAQASKLPPRPPRWGYVATAGDLLFGTRSKAGREAEQVFAVDLISGRRAWVHDGKKISQVTIAVSDGKLFFAEADASPGERASALKEKTDRLAQLKGDDLRKAQEAIKTAEVRRVVALDAATGRKLWEKCVDLTGCRHKILGGGELVTMCSKGVLVVCAASGDGHYWEQFLKGEFAQRRIVALSAEDGSTLWDKTIGYRIRPLIVGDILVAEPWAFDLRTGEQRMREHPITGEKAPWQYARPGHHCGAVSACLSTLFFRSFSIAWYDLLGDCGTTHFSSQRPGCWINIIPANGLVLIPEASSGCLCPFPNMCTVVLEPRKGREPWAFYSVPGSATPVKHLALNLGAPGDRRAADGTLWLGYPRPTGSLVFPLKLETRFLPKGGLYRENPQSAGITGTDTPWLFASGARGLSRCVVPIAGESDLPGLYTVRLGFADPDNPRPGRRVFDIRLQGETVLKDFDIVSEAGGRNAAVVKQFEGIHAPRSLTIDLVTKGSVRSPDGAPVLNSIEVTRTRALPVSLRAPSFVLSDLRPELTRPITLLNHTDQEFAGELLCKPAGAASDPVGVAPQRQAVRLGPKEKATLMMTVTMRRGAAPGEYRVLMSLAGPKGTAEAVDWAAVTHLGRKRQIALPAVEDGYVKKQTPQKNYGADPQLWADGGEKELGDAGQCIAYFKFRLDVPGRPLSARVRLPVGTWAAAESTDSGVIRLVEGTWSEDTLTYENRPTLGALLATIGKVKAGEIVDRKLDVSLEGREELSIAIDPTGLDGAGYSSRQSSTPPELIVEFGP